MSADLHYPSSIDWVFVFYTVKYVPAVPGVCLSKFQEFLVVFLLGFSLDWEGSQRSLWVWAWLVYWLGCDFTKCLRGEGFILRDHSPLAVIFLPGWIPIFSLETSGLS